MRADNTTTGHNRTIRFTCLKELDYIDVYLKNPPMTGKQAICLDNEVIPAIITAINRPTSIVICARCWSSPHDGTSIHSAYIFLNGERIAYHRNQQYSDSESIEANTIDLLISKGKLSAREYETLGNGYRKDENNYSYCQRHNIKIETVVSWVERKKDL